MAHLQESHITHTIDRTANGYIYVTCDPKHNDVTDWIISELKHEIDHQVVSIPFKMDSFYHNILFSKPLVFTATDNNSEASGAITLYNKYWGIPYYQSKSCLGEYFINTQYRAPVSTNDNSWDGKTMFWINIRRPDMDIDGECADVAHFDRKKREKDAEFRNTVAQLKHDFKQIFFTNIIDKCKEIEVEPYVHLVFHHMMNSHLTSPLINDENYYVSDEMNYANETINKLYISTRKPNVIIYFCDTEDEREQELLVQQLGRWISVIDENCIVFDRYQNTITNENTLFLDKSEMTSICSFLGFKRKQFIESNVSSMSVSITKNPPFIKPF